MSRSKPYQTLIFRCLHAGQGILAILGAATGYWLFNTWDHRWGHLSFLPRTPDWGVELHENIGGLFSGAIALFIVYSVWAGHRRLVQRNSLSQLTKVGKPAWWYTLHRLVNTGLLIVGILVVLSGDALEDDALMGGRFSGIAYSLHLIGWIGMMWLTLCHFLLSLKVGGAPLLLSVLSTKVRPKDTPTYWPHKLLAEVSRGQTRVRTWLSVINIYK